MIDKKIVGNRIKELRQKKRLTVEECCIAVGVSESAWRKYEGGYRVPRYEVMLKIADFFKRSVQSIFFE